MGARRCGVRVVRAPNVSHRLEAVLPDFSPLNRVNHRRCHRRRLEVVQSAEDRGEHFFPPGVFQSGVPIPVLQVPLVPATHPIAAMSSTTSTRGACVALLLALLIQAASAQSCVIKVGLPIVGQRGGGRRRPQG